MGQTWDTVLVDHDRLLLESLPHALSQAGPIQVTGCVADIPSGLRMASALSPHVLLVKELPFRTDAQAIAEFLPIRLGRMKLALIADRLTDLELQRAIAMPVTGFFSFKDSVVDLAMGLEAVARGEKAASRHLDERIAIDPATNAFQVRQQKSLATLTNLQLQILVHLANGLRVREIADKLNLTAKAVESHKYRLMQRLNVHDRLGLCRWAIREGLIDP